MLYMKTFYKILAISILIVVFAGLIMFGVNRQSQTDVSTTFYPIYEFTKQIVRDRLIVTNLTPAGAEPHDYEPSPQQLANALNSKLFIYNGVEGFEPWTSGFLKDYKNVSVKSSNNVTLHAHETHQDPHFWLDPVNAKLMVDNILQGLIKTYPQDAAYFTANANSYKAELDKLDQDFEQGLANCQTRTLVTSHEAFGYLADRYNLNIVSIAGISPDEEPSPQQLAQVTKTIRDNNVKYVFFETLASPRLADTIASETGAKTAVLDPLEGLTDEEQRNRTYISVQLENLANIRAALTCQ